MSTWYSIIKLADEQIRNKGYNAFSYGDLSMMIGVRPAAIHYYFRSKTDLGVAVVRQELFRLSKYRKFCGNTPGEEQFKHLAGIFYRNCENNKICLMGSLMPDFATFEPAMQRSVQELSGAISDWVAHFLERARDEGSISFEGKASDRALMVISTLLSSLLMARVLGKDVFIRMADQMLQDLGAVWRIGDLDPVGRGGAHSYTWTN